MTNYEYIIESKEHMVDFIERLTMECAIGEHYGICNLCAFFDDGCPDVTCQEGHMAWLDSDYDEYFWEE